MMGLLCATRISFATEKFPICFFFCLFFHVSLRWSNTNEILRVFSIGECAPLCACVHDSTDVVRTFNGIAFLLLLLMRLPTSLLLLLRMECCVWVVRFDTIEGFTASYFHAHKVHIITMRVVPSPSDSLFSIIIYISAALCFIEILSTIRAYTHIPHAHGKKPKKGINTAAAPRLQWRFRSQNIATASLCFHHCDTDIVDYHFQQYSFIFDF